MSQPRIKLPYDYFPKSKWANETIRELEAGADPNALLYGEITPLEIAVEEKNEAVVSALLNHGANPNVRIRKYETVLFEAIRNGLDSIVDMLLAHGAEVNIMNDAEISPLVQAIYKENPHIIQALLRAGADANSIGSRHSPLFLAQHMTNPDIVKLLLDAGADMHAPIYEGTTTTSFEIACNDARPYAYQGRTAAKKAEILALMRESARLNRRWSGAKREWITAAVQTARHLEPLYPPYDPVWTSASAHHDDSDYVPSGRDVPSKGPANMPPDGARRSRALRFV